MKRLFVLFPMVALLIPALTSTAASDVQYSTEDQIFVESQAVPCTDNRREAVINLFKCYGARDSEIAVSESGYIKNVVVTLNGKGTGRLVIGAHYDKVTAGCGAIDNWTGIVLLVHLFRTFRQLHPSRTLVFVAFGAEEEGLKGSAAMVRAISREERLSYCAMVNLDSFGLATPQAMENTSTPALVVFAKAIAEKAKVPFGSAAISGADADSSSFKVGGIPAITIHALSDDWPRFLHSPFDKPKLINPTSMYLSYILAVNLIANLDDCTCDRFRSN